MGRTARRLGPSLEISIALLRLTRSLVGGVAAHTLPCGAEIDSDHLYCFDGRAPARSPRLITYPTHGGVRWHSPCTSFGGDDLPRPGTNCRLTSNRVSWRKWRQTLEQAGGKELVICSSGWADEYWQVFGVEEFPSLEAAQHHHQALQTLNWYRYIESTTTLGTALEAPA